MLRSAQRRVGRLCAVVAVVCAALFPILNRFTAHAGETVIVLMVPALGALLWFGWPRVRRIRAWQVAVYVAAIVGLMAGAEAFVAHVAAGRVLWPEVLWATYFVLGWRLAWAVWVRTAGRLGERFRRWGRLTRRAAGGLRRIGGRKRRRWAAVLPMVGPLRFCLTLFLFVPLAFGSLIHRFKIGNAEDLGPYAGMPIEHVSFPTTDGLQISGWFFPDDASDATVVICHGLGANKGNVIAFVSLFRDKGYSSLIFDFRGHGESDGHTSTFGLHETADVTAAVDWLKIERPARARHVFGLGSSMGAMALVRAAATDERIEALVLDSAYVSARSLARHHTGRIPVVGPVVADLLIGAMSLHAGGSLWDLDSRPALSEMAGRPVLFIHGRGDFVIPPANMATLYDHASQPKSRWLGPGLHSNVLAVDFPGYQRRVVAFFDQNRVH